MPMSRAGVFFLTLMQSAMLQMPAKATSVHPMYELPWPDKTRQLGYRSCGCADSCWTAELRERTSRRLKASLHCDCYALLAVHPAGTAERQIAASCSVINDAEDKNEAIVRTMKAMLDGGTGKD